MNKATTGKEGAHTKQRATRLAVGLPAAFMILVSYLIEAWRARREKNRSLGQISKIIRAFTTAARP
ncbi:MAG: hypothetical protein AB1641_19405 [Thermodesulfobacteriota bacterium]